VLSPSRYEAPASQRGPCGSRRKTIEAGASGARLRSRSFATRMGMKTRREAGASRRERSEGNPVSTPHRIALMFDLDGAGKQVREIALGVQRFARRHGQVEVIFAPEE